VAWRRLKRLFPTWALFGSSFATPGAWTMIGNDFISGLRRNRSTRQTFALLEDVSGDDFDTLTALAALNSRRQEQVWRIVFLAYITVPLTLVATWSEIAPDGVQTYVRDNPEMTLLIVLGLTSGAVTYWMSFWRSRQMVSVLDLVRIERRIKPFTALELRDE